MDVLDFNNQMMKAYVNSIPEHKTQKFYIFSDDFMADKKAFILSMVDKEPPLDYLPNIEGCFVITRNIFYYKKVGDVVECGVNTIGSQTQNYNILRLSFNVKTKKWTEREEKSVNIRNREFFKFAEREREESFVLISQMFFNLLIFINLSKDKIVYDTFKPNERKGSKKFGNLRTNPTEFNISYVKSNWNVTKIYKGIVKVRGHFRLQPCGVGRNDVKLILIEEHVRKQFTKPSKREEILNSRVS